MTTTPQPLDPSAATTLLQAFGLDQLLKPEDDPLLWATALQKHWPAPTDPALYVQGLRFGLGRRTGPGEATTEGIADIQEWCFERTGDEGLRIVECAAGPHKAAWALAAGSGIQTLTQGGLPTGPAPWPRMTLIVTHPTQGTAEAVVHSGVVAGPMAGQGQSMVWKKQEDGRWVETGECVARWLS